MPVPGSRAGKETVRVIDLADANSQAEPCLLPKPAAVRSKHKAPSFSNRPGLQRGGVTSGDFIKEVWRHSMPVHAESSQASVSV